MIIYTQIRVGSEMSACVGKNWYKMKRFKLVYLPINNVSNQIAQQGQQWPDGSVSLYADWSYNAIINIILHLCIYTLVHT